jgi:uncharacterized damage-inducible protein DinB
MFDPPGFAEIHGRVHSGTARLLEHCRQLSAAELVRDLQEHGFGVPTVQEQLHHIIGAEQYWMGVLRGRYVPGVERTAQEQLDSDMHNFPDIDALEAYRRRIAAETQAWLAEATPEQLDTAAEVYVWDGKARTLQPALVLLRILTHHHHHRGQVAAMTRLLGYPPPESRALVFPLLP